MKLGILYSTTLILSFALAVRPFRDRIQKNMPMVAEPKTPFENLMYDLLVDLKAQRNETWKTEVMLHWFHEQLMTFILESHFDTFRFGVVYQKIIEDFRNIFKKTHDIIGKNTQLLKQFEFLTNMLDTMIYSTLLLANFEFVGSAQNYLINRMVDLNIRIYRMYNSCGRLDTKKLAHKQKLLVISLEILYWYQKFNDLKDVSSLLKDVFNDQKKQAEKATQDLLSQAV